MSDPVSLDALFRESGDFFALLGSDRRLLEVSPAFRAAVPLSREGVDFLDLALPGAQARLATDLAKAAGGQKVLARTEHASRNEHPVRVEWHFWPVDGGLVAGLGRPRAEDPAFFEQMGRVNEELREKTRILDHIQIELTQVPFIDPVTSVWNRLQVVERLTGEWSRSERYASPISVLLVEVEGLGELRSRHGAFVADETMKAVARRLKRTVRDHDVVGRYGDARFVLVAVADKDGARALCGRIQRAVQHEPVTVAELKLPVEVRIGGATNRSEGVEIMEDLFTVAEAALARTNPDTAAIHITE